MKNEINFSIERLEEGYIITKNDNRIAVQNADSLESSINISISKRLGLKDNLYFKKYNKANIKVIVEFFE